MVDHSAVELEVVVTPIRGKADSESYAEGVANLKVPIKEVQD